MNTQTPHAPHSFQDRNFDDIADHFAHKIYGGLKGRIRLAVLERDLQATVSRLSASLGRPLRILDVGAGLAQLSLSFAKTHHATINDISANMLAKARQDAKDLGVNDEHLRFICCAYQDLHQHIKGQKFDLILCHAVLEWLANPEQIMDFFDEFLNDDITNGGVLSLCFYNPASLIYRNLVMGNFNQLTHPKPADTKSLTPNNPTDPRQVRAWLEQHDYQLISQSGIRVFSDYAPLKRGGLNNPDDIVAMELRYAQTEPFCHMGRSEELV